MRRYLLVAYHGEDLEGDWHELQGRYYTSEGAMRYFDKYLAFSKSHFHYGYVQDTHLPEKQSVVFWNDGYQWNTCLGDPSDYKSKYPGLY